MRIRKLLGLLTALIGAVIGCDEVTRTVEPSRGSQPRLCTLLGPTGVFPSGLAESDDGSTAGKDMRAVAPTACRWQKNVLKVRFLGGNPIVRARVQSHALLWTTYANVTFVFGDFHDADIRVSFINPGPSESYVGRCWQDAGISLAQPTMNFGWLDPNTPDDEYRRVVLHEFGHALGLAHEHQSPAGGIPWDEPAVLAYYKNCCQWDEQKTRSNVLTKFDSSMTQYTRFDPRSIMLYPVPNELTIGDFQIGLNNTLSAVDRTFIASWYPPVWGTGHTQGDLIGDFDGNGKDDVKDDVIQFSQGRALVRLSFGKGFLQWREWGRGHTDGDKIGDFNGDRKDDVIQFHKGRALVRLSNPTGTGGFGAWREWGQGHTDGDKIGDFNGDHKDDVIQFHKGRALVRLSNPTGTDGFGAWHEWGQGHTDEDKVGDFNGDDKDDVIQFHERRALVRLSNSTGTDGFGAWREWGTGHTTDDEVGNFNGDRFDDVIQFWRGRGIVRLSTGSIFGSWADWHWGVGPHRRIGDFDGDRKSDVIEFDPATQRSLVRLSSPPLAVPSKPATRGENTAR